MPNWCENVLEISGENPELINAIFNKVMVYDKQQKRYVVDFNLLIPIPEELEIISCNVGDNSAELLSFSKETPLTDKFIYEKLRLSEKNEQRLLTLSIKECWNVGDFIQWLKSNPEEQIEFNYDLTLGQTYLDNQKKYGAPNWYKWRYQNWGVKWNADTQYFDETFSEGDTSFFVIFNTPWNPPIEWINTLIKAFPEVHIKLTYFEPGVIFGGIESSDANEQCYYEYPETIDNLWHIAEEFGYGKEDFGLEE